MYVSISLAVILSILVLAPEIVISTNEVEILDVYNAIKLSKRIYPDSIVKELEAFREKFKEICAEENIVLPIVSLEEVKQEF